MVNSLASNTAFIISILISPEQTKNFENCSGQSMGVKQWKI
jgi:hypothetical protein